ncbi:MAG: histidine phosphatase family protein [Actinomycetota bacterium]|jgi:8-oxo-dGTP diphosphatase|nr:histidine phosphatase family protein [Actinomycetota bacterium]
MSVHLVRHAKAGDRSEWDGPDELRPLSNKGAGQAAALAELLAAEPLKRILTSRYRRCLQTVEPLAERLGLDVETHPALSEEADPAATWALLEELTGTEAVACTHGNLIGPVLDRLHRQGVELLTDRWTCKKGSTWTVEVGPDGALTRARYLPPPV